MEQDLPVRTIGGQVGQAAEELEHGKMVLVLTGIASISMDDPSTGRIITVGVRNHR